MRWVAPNSVLLLLLAASPAQLPSQSGGSLPAPTGLEASDGAYSTKVGLSWDAIRGATAYEILRAGANNAGSAASVGTTASLIFYDISAVPEQRYFYWVRAQNGSLKSGFSNSDQGYRATGRTDFAGVLLAPLNPPREPPGNLVTGAKIYLGKILFWDEQLSSTRTVACGTCHRPRSGGSDPRSVGAPARVRHPGADGIFGTADDVVGSPGVPLSEADGHYQLSASFGLQEQVTRRKSQSALDAGYATSLFWDGRAGQQFKDPITGAVVLQSGAALESQALMPPVAPEEMSHEGAHWDNVVARLTAAKPLALSPSIPPPLAAWIGGRSYPELFVEAFGTPEITAVRIAMAIATYERTLYSDRTPFDAVLSQIVDDPPAEKRGRAVFLDARCDGCHRGSVLSDGGFHYIGLRPAEEDKGRSEVTGQLGSFGRFRTPSLRNSALRGPFMHDGRFATLEEVVDFYDRGGDFDAPHLNRTFIRRLGLSVQQKSDLVAFMKNELTDPRVAAEAGPLFDRPMLYSESARVPQIVGTGSSASGGSIPQVLAIEPPFAGNPNFTVGLLSAQGGASAVLVIDKADPGPGPGVPATASFLRREVAVAGEGPVGGYASVSLSMPSDPALIGTTLFGRWFVLGPGNGVSATPAFRLTIFSTGSPPPTGTILSSVSAASLAIGLVAMESIVSGFGQNFSTATDTASTLPLPTNFAGVSVSVRDSTGGERLAPLFYASPTQINYQIPPGTAAGEAQVSVLRNGAIVGSGTVQVAAVAPALFSANSSGRDTAAAAVLRIRGDGSERQEAVARFDQTQGKFVSEPIDLGPEGDQVFLSLYGTGLRFRGPAEVTARIGGAAAEVLFAGAQPNFVGVDQMNLRLSRSLSGRGEVEVVVTVDGQTSNTVTVNVR